MHGCIALIVGIYALCTGVSAASKRPNPFMGITGPSRKQPRPCVCSQGGLSGLSGVASGVSSRQLLLRRVASLHRGMMNEFALNALETALEVNSDTVKGQRLLLDVLDLLQAETMDGANRGVQRYSWNVEAQPIPFSLSDLEPGTSGIPASLGDAVDQALEELARARLEQTIVAIRSDLIDCRMLTSGEKSNPVEKRVAFNSLMVAFGFWPARAPKTSSNLEARTSSPGSCEIKCLRTAKGRDYFDNILNRLQSEAKLRLQVQAIYQVIEQGFTKCLEAWDGIFNSPDFDSLETEFAHLETQVALEHSTQKSPVSMDSRCTDSRPKDTRSAFRKSVVDSACERTLGRVPPSILDSLVTDSMSGLRSLTTEVTRRFRVTSNTNLVLPASTDEAKCFLAALIESFPLNHTASPDGKEDSALYSISALYKRVFRELCLSKMKSRVFFIRSRPFTLWHDEWLAFFESDLFDGIRKELEVGFGSDGQAEEDHIR